MNLITCTCNDCGHEAVKRATVLTVECPKCGAGMFKSEFANSNESTHVMKGAKPMKKLLSMFVAAALALSLTACGKKEAEVKTSEQLRAEALAKSDENRKLQDLLEQQRSTAMANIQANVANYFAMNPRFDASWKVIPHTDDYIGPSCPQGSGWAWVNVMHVEGKDVEKKKLWCSTSSQSLGCYIEADFLKGPHAGEEGRCDPNLPHPLKAFK